jgi:hypothetical protein
MSIPYKAGATVARVLKPRVDPLSVLFFVCLSLGGAFSFSNYIVPPTGFFPLIGPVVATVLYCLIASHQIATKRRHDYEQTADSCYYLGFLITLFSLIASLLALGGGGLAPGNSIVLERFGAALGTTVIGMLFRVMLVQFRKSPEEKSTEANARISSTIVDLSTSMDRAVDDFEKSLKVASEKLAGAGEEVRGEMRSGAKAHSEAMEKMVQQLDRTLSTAADTISVRISEMSLEPKEFQESLQSVMDTIEEEVTSFRGQVTELKKATTQNKTAWGKLTAEVDGAADKIGGAQDKLAGLGLIVDGLMNTASASEKLSAQLDALCTKVEATGGALEDGGGAMRAQVKAAHDDIATIKQLRSEIDAERQAVVKAVDEVFKHLTNAADSIVNELR